VAELFTRAGMTAGGRRRGLRVHVGCGRLSVGRKVTRKMGKSGWKQSGHGINTYYRERGFACSCCAQGLLHSSPQLQMSLSLDCDETKTLITAIRWVRSAGIYISTSRGKSRFDAQGSER